MRNAESRPVGSVSAFGIRSAKLMDVRRARNALGLTVPPTLLARANEVLE
jgi:hypothetical protein